MQMVWNGAQSLVDSESPWEGRIMRLWNCSGVLEACHCGWDKAAEPET
jgi:hypothetical protein